MTPRRLRRAAAIAVLVVSGCGTTPGTDGLRESFAEQLAANRYVSGVEREGDEFTFSGPGAEGGTATWRVHIDALLVEAQDDPMYSYKGTVRSSWYSDGQLVEPAGRESNLPVPLIDNGLSQDCWALWNAESNRWEWE